MLKFDRVEPTAYKKLTQGHQESGVLLREWNQSCIFLLRGSAEYYIIKQSNID